MGGRWLGEDIEIVLLYLYIGGSVGGDTTTAWDAIWPVADDGRPSIGDLWTIWLFSGWVRER